MAGLLPAAWLGPVGQLAANSYSYSLPGMAAFLQAACNLESLELESPDLISSAQADHLLQLCSQVQHVRIQGGCSHLPSHFPASLATLDVSLHSAGLDFDVQQPSALIWRLAHHMDLDQLSLDFGRACPFVLQASPVQLQPLYLWLCFRISCGMYDLSWLRHQPVTRLEREIHVQTTEHAAHEKTTSELQHLPISSLTLFFYEALPPAVQALWKAVTVKRSYNVNLMSQFFQTMGATITALPRCSCRRLFLQADTCKPPGQPISLEWAAVVSQAGYLEACRLTKSFTTLVVVMCRWSMKTSLGSSLSAPHLVCAPHQLCTACRMLSRRAMCWWCEMQRQRPQTGQPGQPEACMLWTGAALQCDGKGVWQTFCCIQKGSEAITPNYRQYLYNTFELTQALGGCDLVSHALVFAFELLLVSLCHTSNLSCKRDCCQMLCCTVSHPFMYTARGSKIRLQRAAWTCPEPGLGGEIVEENVGVETDLFWLKFIPCINSGEPNSRTKVGVETDLFWLKFIPCINSGEPNSRTKAVCSCAALRCCNVWQGQPCARLTCVLVDN